jgi:hypothetical protein
MNVAAAMLHGCSQEEAALRLIGNDKPDDRS